MKIILPFNVKMFIFAHIQIKLDTFVMVRPAAIIIGNGSDERNFQNTLLMDTIIDGNTTSFEWFEKNIRY